MEFDALRRVDGTGTGASVVGHAVEFEYDPDTVVASGAIEQLV